MKIKKILITGAAGFIGKALSAHLESTCPHCRIIGVSRGRSSFPGMIPNIDLLNEKKVVQLLKSERPDGIFHLAGGRKADDKETFESNFATTKILLTVIESISDYRPRILLPGTAAEYGQVSGRQPIKESRVPKPANWYGNTKYMQTLLGVMAAKKGQDIVIARMFNVLGKGVPTSLVIGKFASEIVSIEKGKKEGILNTRGLGDRRDFLDIQDVCRALVLIMFKGTSGEIYHVSSGRSIAIRELLNQMLALSNQGNILVQEDRSRPSQITDSIGSNAKIKKALGWKPHVPIEKSLYDTLEYYRALKKRTPL